MCHPRVEVIKLENDRIATACVAALEVREWEAAVRPGTAQPS